MPANDRLADALSAAGLSPHSLATLIGVDPKTVERWLTQGRTPYPRHRREVAAAVRESESYLWPDALAVERRTAAATSEIVRIYPHRASIPSDVWSRLFGGVNECLDVHLRQLEEGDLFAMYAEVFERVWAEARPAWREAVA